VRRFEPSFEKVIRGLDPGSLRVGLSSNPELTVGDFRKLEVWQTSHSLGLAVYRATAKFPSSELYGLTSQMRRVATSISANLAEGCGRQGDPELRRFIRYSLGSATELEYHILLARDLKLLDASTLAELDRPVHQIQAMLLNLSRALIVKKGWQGRDPVHSGPAT
jgi:four helix bundle protein